MNKAVAVLALSGILVAGCLKTLDPNLVVGAGIDLAKSFSVSDSQMVALANQSIGEMDGSSKVAGANDPYSIRLNRLFAKHKNSAQVPLDYKVYYDTTLNAFAMPNGSIRVHTGLMDLLNDDELVGVIGHEIGHVVAEHSMARYKSSYRTLAGQKIIASTGGTLGQLGASQIGALSTQFLNSKFSRNNELEADAYGVNLLKTNNHNPRALITAFEKMRRVHGDGGGIFASHPSNSQRIAAIEALIAAN